MSLLPRDPEQPEAGRPGGAPRKEDGTPREEPDRERGESDEEARSDAASSLERREPEAPADPGRSEQRRVQDGQWVSVNGEPEQRSRRDPPAPSAGRIPERVGRKDAATPEAGLEDVRRRPPEPLKGLDARPAGGGGETPAKPASAEQHTRSEGEGKLEGGESADVQRRAGERQAEKGRNGENVEPDRSERERPLVEVRSTRGEHVQARDPLGREQIAHGVVGEFRGSVGQCEGSAQNGEGRDVRPPPGDPTPLRNLPRRQSQTSPLLSRDGRARHRRRRSRRILRDADASVPLEDRALDLVDSRGASREPEVLLDVVVAQRMP